MRRWGAHGRGPPQEARSRQSCDVGGLLAMDALQQPIPDIIRGINVKWARLIHARIWIATTVYQEVAMFGPTTRAAPQPGAGNTKSRRADALCRNAARHANRDEARKLVHDPLLNAREAAAEAGVALSTWWKWVKLGRFPAPSYPLPRCPRWRRSQVLIAVQTMQSAA